MKKKAIKLESLKIQSFVTAFEDNKDDTIKGGWTGRGCGTRRVHPLCSDSWCANHCP